MLLVYLSDSVAQLSSVHITCVLVQFSTIRSVTLVCLVILMLVNVNLLQMLSK